VTVLRSGMPLGKITSMCSELLTAKPKRFTRRHSMGKEKGRGCAPRPVAFL